MFAPESVSEPEPVWVSDIVPVPFWMTPENVVEALAPPVVSVAAVALESVTKPAPANPPMLLLYPARSSVAPLDTVIMELVPKAVVEPACRVPALTVVPPV